MDNSTRDYFSNNLPVLVGFSQDNSKVGELLFCARLSDLQHVLSRIMQAMFKWKDF